MHNDSAQVRPAAAQISDAERHARRELAACYRLADRMGWSDIISSHISHRVPGEPGHYLINPYGMLFDEITASALIKTDAHGTILSASEYPLNPAVLVIHAAILDARPDLNCVMHLHTRDGTAVSMQEHGLLAASQHALVVWDKLCYHEFEGIALDDEEKHSLVRDLGADKKLMLLRNHGTISCGATRSVRSGRLLGRAGTGARAVADAESRPTRRRQEQGRRGAGIKLD